MSGGNDDVREAYQSPTDATEEKADAQTPAQVSATPDPSITPDTAPKGLRWWPVPVLLLLMFAISKLPGLYESPPLFVFIIGFMGPIAIGGLILVWWLFASRASWTEKLQGFAGFALIAVLGLASLHQSLQGMMAMIFVIPTSIAAFAIGILLFLRTPRTRVITGLMACLLGFGFWGLLQNEGTTGTFETQLLWRWEPNAEAQYLESDIQRIDQSDLEQGVTITSVPWPEFRGANRDGVVSGVTLSEDWESNPPREIWKQRIGPGWSSFSIATDSQGRTRLYTQEQRDQDEAVVCLDGESGAIIWDFLYKDRFWEAIGGAGPRATPTLAEGRLYCLGANGVLVALDPITGDEFWRQDFRKDPGLQPPTWGFSASPLVVDGKVFVHAGSELVPDGKVIAYDAQSGEMLWKTNAGNHTYSSAHQATLAGVPGILMVCNNGIRFLDPNDGTNLWFHEWKASNYRVLQPLIVGSDIVFSTSLGEGTMKIHIDKSEAGEWTTEETWYSQGLKPSFNDTVYYDGHLYGFDMEIFASADFETGDRNWKRGRYGNGQVLLFEDSGQLLVISEKGKLILVQANPEKLDERASIQALDGKTWNHPVLVGNRLYLRNATEIACYELSIETPSADSTERPVRQPNDGIA